MLALHGPLFQAGIYACCEESASNMQACCASITSLYRCILYDAQRCVVIIRLERRGLMQSQDFDLVVSGINRGDNLGLHVIYSGTVGAAEEAAIKASNPTSSPTHMLQQSIARSSGSCLGPHTEFAGSCCSSLPDLQLQCTWHSRLPACITDRQGVKDVSQSCSVHDAGRSCNCSLLGQLQGLDT